MKNILTFCLLALCMYAVPNYASNYDKKFEELAAVLQNSSSADERYDAIRKIYELSRKQFISHSLIKGSLQLAMDDNDSRIRDYAIRYLPINEKTIPLLLHIITDNNDQQKKTLATFTIGYYFTENGSDPTQYYYVIDKNISLAIKAYEALDSFEPNSYTSKVMLGIISSGLRFCGSEKYRNLALIYKRFKTKIVSYDKEAYEICKSQ